MRVLSRLETNTIGGGVLLPDAWWPMLGMLGSMAGLYGIYAQAEMTASVTQELNASKAKLQAYRELYGELPFDIAST